uniref:Tc1-like transposase DDE domain-containing protein n=1 Tax=Cyprinus carpio carpio TaxID=630221 RepID=A0A9J7YNT3_CYPCA
VETEAAGGVMVVGIFSWHTLGSLVPTEHRLNTTVFLSIVADHVYAFMTTVHPSSDDYFQQDNAPCHKAQIISDCLWPVGIVGGGSECTALSPPSIPRLRCP